MPSGIGSWRRRENSGRLVGSRLREERRGPVFRAAGASDEAGYFGSRIRGRPLPTHWGHSYLLSPLHAAWAMLVNTTAWWKTDSVGPSTSGCDRMGIYHVGLASSLAKLS